MKVIMANAHNFQVRPSLMASCFTKSGTGHAIQLRVQVDDMPAFRDKLSRDEVWAVVEYLKVLRTPHQ
jgi:hypothetical protein